MSLTIPSSPAFPVGATSLSNAVRNPLLRKEVANPDGEASASGPATSSDAPPAANAPAKDDKRPADAGSNTGRQRVEVRRDVTDAGSIKVTVITQSDGTSDSLSQVKPGATAPEPSVSNRNPFAKGALIDKLA